MGNLRRSWAELSLEKKLSIVFIPLLVAAIGTGVPLLVAGGSSDSAGGEAAEQAPRSNLEVIDLAVTNGSPRGDRDAIQAVDLTVRNAGDLVAIVKRMELRIRASALLEICQAGGGLEPSERYRVLLPPDPDPGDLVQAKLSQQIGPGKADRFTVGLDVPEPARQIGDRLYQMDVLLYVDTAKRPVRAGTVVAAAPYLPENHYFRSGQISDDFDPIRACLEKNEANFKRMLALEGERSPELSLDLLRR
jgi:hypothetical protein